MPGGKSFDSDRVKKPHTIMTKALETAEFIMSHDQGADTEEETGEVAQEEAEIERKLDL